MKLLRVTQLLVAALSAGVAVAGINQSRGNYLWPVDVNVDSSYRKLLQTRLYLTPADCGRMIVMAAFGGDNAVSVYTEHRDGPGGRTRYMVTYTIVESKPQRSEEIGRVEPEIKRADVEISEGAATAVRRVWRVMLERPIPQLPEESPSGVVVDGDIVEFSLSLPGAPLLLGALLDDHGPNTEALWQLGLSLIRYSQAAPPEREGIAQKIERDANRLASTIESERRM